MPRFASFAAPVAIAIVLALPAQTPAQTQTQGQSQAQTAAEVLLRASGALADARTGTAELTLVGQAPETFAKTMPSAKATLTWRRPEGDAPAALRLAGTGRDRQDNPERSFDTLYEGDRIVFLDHDRKQRVEATAQSKDPRLSVPNTLRPEELTAPTPLSAMLEGTEVALEGEQTLDGQACDIVLVTFPEADDPRQRRTYARERWYIARADAFPRRIEKIAEWPMIGRITMTVDFTDVRLNPGLSEGDLTLEAPEGYTDAAGRAVVRPAAVRPAGDAQPRPGAAPQEQAAEDPAPPSRFPVAPEFAITDDDGKPYTTQTQAGRTTVLYFWGTWCVPCREYSPLVSAMAESFADAPVDVLGVAVREQSPDAARALMDEKGYKHTLAMAPDGLPGDFRVRVYPTIVVIGPDQSLRLVTRPQRDVTPEALMEQVNEAVRAAVGG